MLQIHIGLAEINLITAFIPTICKFFLNQDYGGFILSKSALHKTRCIELCSLHKKVFKSHIPKVPHPLMNISRMSSHNLHYLSASEWHTAVRAWH